MEYDVMLAVLRKINAIEKEDDYDYIHLELYVDGKWALVDSLGIVRNDGNDMNELLQCLTVLKGEK